MGDPRPLVMNNTTYQPPAPPSGPHIHAIDPSQEGKVEEGDGIFGKHIDPSEADFTSQGMHATELSKVAKVAVDLSAGKDVNKDNKDAEIAPSKASKVDTEVINPGKVEEGDGIFAGKYIGPSEASKVDEGDRRLAGKDLTSPGIHAINPSEVAKVDVGDNLLSGKDLTKDGVNLDAISRRCICEEPTEQARLKTMRLSNEGEEAFGRATADQRHDASLITSYEGYRSVLCAQELKRKLQEVKLKENKDQLSENQYKDMSDAELKQFLQQEKQLWQAIDLKERAIDQEMKKEKKKHDEVVQKLNERKLQIEKTMKELNKAKKEMEMKKLEIAIKFQECDAEGGKRRLKKMKMDVK